MAKAPAHQPLNLKFPASTKSVTTARHFVEDYARSLGMRDVDDIGLAVTEAIGNAVLHAYRAREPGTIELRAEWLVPDTLLVVIIDDGDGMSPHPEAPGLGLGLPLMASLPARLEIERHNPHGTTVRMRFSLAA